MHPYRGWRVPPCNNFTRDRRGSGVVSNGRTSRSGLKAATNKERIMKTWKQFLSMAAVVALSGISASAADTQSVTVQYGQGTTTTFFKPSERKTTVENGK